MKNLPSVPKEIQQLLTSEQAWHYQVIPFNTNNNTLSLYVNAARDEVLVKDELEVLTGKQINLTPIEPELLVRTLTILYRQPGKDFSETGSVDARRSESFLSDLVSEAKALNSSDIHIESGEKKGRVRFRIDGNLVERYTILSSDYPALVNRIKIKAALDIAEKRRPQDGRILFDENKMRFDIRISILPTLYGEKVVLRLLNRDAYQIQLSSLGFGEGELNAFLKQVRKPHGIILISGPTGSGKTTTLYATLNLLNEVGRNIVTIEDPIEYTLDGINQVQVNEGIGLSFASALRTFLRQDPDIIMLGEIRDPETAQMAIRAAQTGHLVLSTVHTNSAWGTISRLSDMGVAPYLLAESLNLSVAQRLIRILCKDCKTPDKPDEAIMEAARLKAHLINKVFKGVGCNHCHFTGYRGRRAIYEVVPITREFNSAIKEQRNNVNELFRKDNISTLRDNALKLLTSGETSLDEVYPFLLAEF